MYYQQLSIIREKRLMSTKLDDYDLRVRLGNEGRKHVIQNFSWDKIIDEYMMLLQNLVQS